MFVMIWLIVTMHAGTNGTVEWYKTDECDYFSNHDYSVSSSEMIKDSITTHDNSFSIQFEIQLNQYCNDSLCGILWIGDTNNKFASISLNGIQNYLELSISNGYGFDDIHRVPNLHHALPTDHTFHNISVSYDTNEFNERQTIMRIDNVSYHLLSISVYDDVSSEQQYSLYLSGDLNATVTNICIQSAAPLSIPCSVCKGEIKCDDTLNGELVSASGIDYYYFNTSQVLPFVMFDACGVLYDIYSYFYDVNLYLYDLNWTVLNHGADTGVCLNKEQLAISDLNAGEYILGIEYIIASSERQWELNVACKNETASPYKLRLGSVTYWIETQLDCEDEFGTSVATITTEQEMTQAMELINTQLDGKMNLTVVIGLYKDTNNGSKWKWVDGSSCDYTETHDCIDDVHWQRGKPSITDQEAIVDAVPLVGSYLSVPLVSNTSFIDDEYIFWRYKELGWLCNAPSGNHGSTHCDHDAVTKCWWDMGCCNDSVLSQDTQYELFEFKPAIAHWDSKLFVIGTDQIHYTNIDLFEYDYVWNHESFESFDYTKNAKRFVFAQYTSSVFLYTDTSQLIHINLETLESQLYITPQTLKSYSVGECIVATRDTLYIFKESLYIIFDLQTTQWTIQYHKWGVDNMPYTCAITHNSQFVYIFGLLVSAGWVDGVIKYDTISDAFFYLDTPGLCTTNSANAITAPNGKIYVHGCYAAPWKTLIFDTETEQFETQTMDIHHTTHTSYYRKGRMTVFDDNMLLLFVPHVSLTASEEGSDSPRPVDVYGYHGMSLYSSVTDAISINFTVTISSEYIWPSDGLAIRYHLNDFTTDANGVYLMWFYNIKNNTINDINASIVLNVSNDHCVCEHYRCKDCYYSLDLAAYLSPMDGEANELLFEPNNYRNFDILILPQQITVLLQRCTISFTTNNPSTDNSKKSIQIDYALSDNCYTRTGKTFSSIITVPFFNISKTLMITIIDNETVDGKLCAPVMNTECEQYDNKTFVIHHDTSNLANAAESVHFYISITSDMVDLRVVSSIDSILFAPLHHKVVHVSNHLWYSHFLV
eukprot:853903_1